MNATDKTELKGLLEQYWGAGNSMADYCLKSDKFIKLDGRFVIVGSAKPAIDTDIYYDDETERPAVNLELFINYNMQKLPKNYELQNRKCGVTTNLYITSAYRNDNTVGKLARVSNVADEDLNRYEHTELVTDEQLKLINKAEDEIRQDFEKRLNTYWKRYSNKVSARGYWANR